MCGLCVLMGVFLWDLQSSFILRPLIEDEHQSPDKFAVYEGSNQAGKSNQR